MIGAHHTPKGAFSDDMKKTKKNGVGKIPETLFVRGKGIDQGFDQHILQTVAIQLPEWCNNTMCAHPNQHEWSMSEHQNVESDCETCQSGTSIHPKHSEVCDCDSYDHEW